MRPTDEQIESWAMSLRSDSINPGMLLDVIVAERDRADKAVHDLKEARLVWSLFDEPKVAGDLEAAKATIGTVWKSRRMWQDRADGETCDKALRGWTFAQQWAAWFAAEAQYRKRVADALAAVRDSLSDTAQRIESILAGDPS